MRYLCFFLYFFSGLFVVHAQTASEPWQVVGHVYGGIHKKPKQYVHIRVGELITQSNAKGYFKLDIPKTTSTQAVLELSFVGYETLQVDVQLPNSTPLNVYLQPKTIQLHEVVTHSIRQQEKAALSSTLVQAKEIEEIYVGEDGPFLLQYKTPGLLVTPQSGASFSNYSAIRLRGMDETRINLTLEGIPLNDMLDQGFYFSNFVDMFESVSSVQVQRGIGSSTHGTAAYAGSINLALPNSFVPAQLGTYLNVGSFQTISGGGELYTGEIGKNNQSAAYARASRNYSRGYREHSTTDGYSFIIKPAHKFKKQLLEPILFSSTTRNRLAYTQVPLPVLEENRRANPISGNERDRVAQTLLALRHTFFLASQSAFSYTVYGRHIDVSVPVGYTDAAGTYNQTVYQLRNKHYGLQAHIHNDFGAVPGGWNIGTQVYFFSRENKEAISPAIDKTTYREDDEKLAFNLFTKAHIPLGRWRFFADLQLRQLSVSLHPQARFLSNFGIDPTQNTAIPTRNWTFFNPKASVSYTLTQSINLYSFIGLSHREPTRNDILGDTNINAGTLAAAQDLSSPKAEQVVDWEFGIKSTNKYLQGGVNVFYMDFRNEIAPIGVYIENFYAQLRENLPKSYRLGIEADFQAQLLPNLRLSGLGYWNRARIERYAPKNETKVYTNVPTGNAPIVLSQLQVNYQLPLLKYRLSLWLRGRYRGKTYLNPISDPRQEALDVFLADAGWVLNIKGLQLGLQVRNLLDTPYYTAGVVQQTAEGPVQSYFGQAGRHVYVTARLNINK